MLSKKSYLAALAASVAAVAISAAPVLASPLTTIAIVTPDQANDFGWNQQGVAAAQAVADKHHLKLIKAEDGGYGDISPTLRDLASQGAGLIIAHASGYATTAVEIGAEQKIPVAITNRPDLGKPGMVYDYSLSGAPGAYLAGRLAAKMSKTGILGIVVSSEVPAWNLQSAGFAEGAKAEKPGIKIRYAVIGPAAYSDVAGAKRVTASVLASGADIIFGEGDGATFGMLAAVETVTPPAGDKYWFIDVIGDKSSIDKKDHLLSSVIWNFQPVFEHIVDQVESGTPSATPFVPSLQNGAISLLRTKNIPAADWAALMADKAAIIDGKITVPALTDPAQVHALMGSVIAAPQ
jgi:simple sugar transport system substrate-binding protein